MSEQTEKNGAPDDEADAAEPGESSAPEESPTESQETPEEPVSETPEPEPEPIAEKPRSRRGLSGFVGWLALLVAAAALVAAGYLSVQGRGAATRSSENDQALATLSRALDAASSSLDTIQGRLDELAGTDSTRRDEIAAMERELDRRLREFDSFPGRIANLEGSISSLKGISAGVRDTWLVAEAEYYMQIANAQLQLAGNPHLAMLALKLADERVLQLADPALTSVRQAISDELRALEVMDKPDVPGITMTLSSLAGVVGSLPLRRDLDLRDAGDAAIDPELSGMRRALESLKRTLSGIVSVRRTDESVKPLIAPEARYFLRANLSLQLQAARLALLRGEQEIFEQSLDDASAWLEEFYDTDTSQVQGALETIAEIRGSLFSVTAPDISTSLRLLRQYNVLTTEDETGR